MPGYLLSVGASVTCVHGGQAQALVLNLRVKASGQPTVQQPNPWIVTGCPHIVSGAPLPCVTAQWITAATRVRSQGLPLLLDDSVAVCTPNGTGVSILTTQVRVKAT